MSAEEAASKFNAAWKGFDENDPTSQLGVVMSLAAVETSFFENIFCNSYVNDKTHKRTGCNQAGTNKSKHEQGNGDADCRFSASLYNSKMLVDKETGLLVPALARRVGYIFDFEKVENLYGKCSYPWDGGSWGRYNNGCGGGMDVASCDSPASAYKNICTSTNKVCTADDPEVTGAFCVGVEGGKSPVQHYPQPPTEMPQCLFPGAAIDYHGQEYNELILRKSHLRDMAVTRAKFKNNTVNGTEHSRNAMFYANEVVIDVRLFLPHMKEDPARAIQAFVYLEELDPESKGLAIQMRDEYSRLLDVDGKVPILMISKSKNPPFVAVDETDDAAIMV